MMINTLILLSISLPFSACTTVTYWAVRSKAPADYKHNPRGHYTKLHMNSGALYIISQASIEKDHINGYGVQYDHTRNLVSEDSSHVTIPVKDILLIETTQPMTYQVLNKNLIGLGVGIALLGAVCLSTNSKACFGSCPTIYNGSLSEAELLSGDLLAESFSDAISQGLERRDLDPLALTRHSPKRGGEVLLTLTNEAYETHAIRSMELLGVELPEGYELAAHSLELSEGGEALYPITAPRAPLSCHSDATGDCLAEIKSPDRLPHLAGAHPEDLGHRERLTITLPDPLRGSVAAPPLTGSRRGVVLYVRNSLLNTFVFYQLWAWLGHRVGDWVMKLEETLATPQGEGGGLLNQEAFSRVAAALGDLKVEVKIGEGARAEWREVGRYDEIGPLAQEQVLLLLPEELSEGPITLRLTAAQGNFRLDYVGTTSVGMPLTPRRLSAQSLTPPGGEADPRRLKALLSPDEHLMTYPGDVLVMRFSDPEGSARSRYFLDAQGYYLEWQQPHWLKEQDEESFIRFFVDPKEGLKRLAPHYKKVEPMMEELFWKSRFRRTGEVKP